MVSIPLRLRLHSMIHLHVREEINKIMFFGKPSPKAPPYDRLDRIEKKLDLIMDHLGLVPPKPDYENEIKELKRKGNQIQAIKRYREITGAGLFEAKNYVDQL